MIWYMSALVIFSTKQNERNDIGMENPQITDRCSGDTLLSGQLTNLSNISINYSNSLIYILYHTCIITMLTLSARMFENMYM